MTFTISPLFIYIFCAVALIAVTPICIAILIRMENKARAQDAIDHAEEMAAWSEMTNEISRLDTVMGEMQRDSADDFKRISQMIEGLQVGVTGTIGCLKGYDDLNTAKLAQLLEIARATNDGIKILCTKPITVPADRVLDVTAQQRRRQDMRDLQEATMHGLPPDLAGVALADLQEEMAQDN